MDLFAFITIISAAFTGASMGSFLFLTLLYSALLKNKKNINDSLFIYRRLYRLNFVLCLIAGICAALISNRVASLMLVIIAASYVFNHAHILKGCMQACDEKYNIINPRQHRALSYLQNMMHLGQFGGAGYVLYLLVP